MTYLVYLFLSSTFSDMQCERDYIMRFSLPEINRRLKEKNVLVKAVDLRWGIDTSTMSEGQHAQKVIKVCLSEIERCRPFFIGLIGDRYGWVPEKELWNEFVLSSSSGKQIFVDKPQSITAAEILSGGIDDEDSMRRSYFFFRNASSYKNLPPDVRGGYVSDGEDSEKLDALKHEIRRCMSNAGHASHLVDYECDCMAARKSLMSLKAFGDLFEETITNAILESLNDGTSLYKENGSQGSVLIGQADTVSDIRDMISVSGSVSFVSGPCGIGKSAVLRAVASEIEAEMDGRKLLLSHIGNPGKSVKELVSEWNTKLCSLIGVHACGDFELFPEYVSSVKGKGIEVIVILDDIDRIDLTYRSELLNLISADCTWILSGESNYFSEIKRISVSAKEIVIPLLGQDDSSLLFLNELLSAGKDDSLSREIISALNNRSNDMGVRAFSPLWVKLASNLLLNLDSEDYAKSAELDSDGGRALKKYIISLVQAFPVSAEGLFDNLTERAYRTIGHDFVGNALAYIALSYDGLTLMDLQELMAPVWTDLKGAYLLRYYVGALGERPSDRRIVFEHQIFKDYVRKAITPSRRTIIYRELYNLYQRYYSGNQSEGLFYLSLHSYSGDLVYSGISAYEWLSILAAFIKEDPYGNLDYVLNVLLHKEKGPDKVILEYVVDKYLDDTVLVQNVLRTIAGDDISQRFIDGYRLDSKCHKDFDYESPDYIQNEHDAIVRRYINKYGLDSISTRCDSLLAIVRNSDIADKAFYMASLMFMRSQAYNEIESYISETEKVISYLHECQDTESIQMIKDQLFDDYLSRLVGDHYSERIEQINHVYYEAKRDVRHSSVHWLRILRTMIRFSCLTGKDPNDLGCELLDVSLEQKKSLGAEWISLSMAGNCAKLWSSSSYVDTKSVIKQISTCVDEVIESPLTFYDILEDIWMWLENSIFGLKENNGDSSDTLELAICLFNLVSKTRSGKLSMGRLFAVAKGVVGEILSEIDVPDGVLQSLFNSEKGLMKYLDTLLYKCSASPWDYAVFNMDSVSRGNAAFANAVLMNRILLLEYEVSGKTESIIPSLINLLDVCDMFHMGDLNYMKDYIGCDVLYLEFLSRHPEDKTKHVASNLFRNICHDESMLIKYSGKVSVDYELRRVQEAKKAFESISLFD